MPNDVHVTASAMAAFDGVQAAFMALVNKGVLSKAEAEGEWQISPRRRRPSICRGDESKIRCRR
jgi:hypothetical protein